ncbi:uncharacterized protein VTP21DRAFT_8512 [Calcarisporiella thermophila]|uniref:uncharacterized protein n=1 Tax=Calcarisporiella thermophila TaxID=911321 RepID=UPI0037420453
MGDIHPSLVLRILHHLAPTASKTHNPPNDLRELLDICLTHVSQRWRYLDCTTLPPSPQLFFTPSQNGNGEGMSNIISGIGCELSSNVDRKDVHLRLRWRHPEREEKEAELERVGMISVPDLPIDKREGNMANEARLEVEGVLNGTLEWMRTAGMSEKIVENLQGIVKKRLERDSESRRRIEERLNSLPPDFRAALAAVVMRTKSTKTRHILYLKDFSNSEWRLYTDNPSDVGSGAIMSEDNVMSLVHGNFDQDKSILEPRWLFYLSEETIASMRADQNKQSLQHSTIPEETEDLENQDYIAANGNCYFEEDIIACRVCQGCDEAPGNKIFLCDDCDNPIHQLCQKPPIRDEEEALDPWYCEECLTKRKRPKLSTNT